MLLHEEVLLSFFVNHHQNLIYDCLMMSDATLLHTYILSLKIHFACVDES